MRKHDVFVVPLVLGLVKLRPNSLSEQEQLETVLDFVGRRPTEDRDSLVEKRTAFQQAGLQRLLSLMNDFDAERIIEGVELCGVDHEYGLSGRGLSAGRCLPLHQLLDDEKNQRESMPMERSSGMTNGRFAHSSRKTLPPRVLGEPSFWPAKASTCDSVSKLSIRSETRRLPRALERMQNRRTRPLEVRPFTGLPNSCGYPCHVVVCGSRDRSRSATASDATPVRGENRQLQVAPRAALATSPTIGLSSETNRAVERVPRGVHGWQDSPRHGERSLFRNALPRRRSRPRARGAPVGVGV